MQLYTNKITLWHFFSPLGCKKLWPNVSDEIFLIKFCLPPSVSVSVGLYWIIFPKALLFVCFCRYVLFCLVPFILPVGRKSNTKVPERRFNKKIPPVRNILKINHLFGQIFPQKCKGGQKFIVIQNLII